MLARGCPSAAPADAAGRMQPPLRWPRPQRLSAPEAYRAFATMSISSISPAVADSLGWYVYLYVDPRDGTVFYVGKGRGQRCLAHLRSSDGSRKARRIREIRRAGLSPRVDLLAHTLPDEATAASVEGATIDLLGLRNLTNEVRGLETSTRGRQTLEGLVAAYTRTPVTIREPSLLFRIRQKFVDGMSPEALYEATRGVWRLNLARARAARLAFAVVHGVIREAYVIDGARWAPAGSSRYATRSRAEVARPGRWEFAGQVAPRGVRNRYVNRDVSGHFVQGQRSPVIYVGV